MKKFSINAAVLLSVLFILVVGIALTFIVSVNSKSVAEDLSDQLIDAVVGEQAHHFEAICLEAYGLVNSMPQVILHLADEAHQNGNASQLRESVISLFTNILETNENLVGIWTGWLYDSFDGRDGEYINAEYHDETGRFIPYVYRDGIGISVEPLVDYEDPINGEYFLGAFNSGKPYITNPFEYDVGSKRTLMYTIAMPIYKNGSVVGVFGADIVLDDIVLFMNEVKILDDGFLVTISPDGFITTHRDTGLILQHYETTWLNEFSNDINSLLKNGGKLEIVGFSTSMNDNVRVIMEGVMIGDTGRYFAVAGMVPIKTINAPANRLIMLAVAYLLLPLLAALVIISLVKFVSNKVYWYESILDHIPMPLSITDKNRNWTFINKPVEDFLGVKRSTVMGKQCSNWGANICKTENCGINCLERGQNTSYFEQPGINMHFKVDSAYLHDKRGHKTGHIEIVNDITDLVQGQKEDAQFVQDISDISQSFVRAASDIDRGANELSHNCMEQTSEVGMLSSSVSVVAEKTLANTSLANKSSELADTIKGNAEKGSAQMDKLAQAVEDINASIQSIGKVFKFIDDIAFQTNILALNAAVEAARAGQHGKGFAVVAEEVRNLAAKSAASAKDTDSLLTSSIEKANIGVQIAGETATSLKDIVSGIDESSLIAREILHSSEEQNKLIDEINKGINEVSQGVQKNSAMAQESAAASTEMNEQAVHLQQLIDEWQKTVENYYD